MSEDQMRFSDERLSSFYREFREHVEDYKAQRAADAIVFRELIDSQAALTREVSFLVESTKGVVSLYDDIQGAVRIGSAAQRFGTWIIKWPLIGTGLFAAWKWLSGMHWPWSGG